MTLDEIKNALMRTEEPEENGIYHVYTNLFSWEYRYVGAIEVSHGPRGGYRRHHRVSLDPTTIKLVRGERYYWPGRNAAWLTPEEHAEFQRRRDGNS
jgi:hypothetical protein